MNQSEQKQVLASALVTFKQAFDEAILEEGAPLVVQPATQALQLLSRRLPEYLDGQQPFVEAYDDLRDFAGVYAEYCATISGQLFHKLQTAWSALVAAFSDYTLKEMRRPPEF